MASKSVRAGSRQVAGSLILVVLAIIVGLSLYATIVGKQRTDSPLAEATTKTTSSATAQATDYYVAFQELGFKIKRTDAMKDFSYLADPDIATIRHVHSAAYDAAVDACRKGDTASTYDSGPDDKAIASFGVGQGQFKQKNHPSESLARQFDSFFITISYPTVSPCKNPDNPELDVPRAAIKALEDALKNAQKV